MPVITHIAKQIFTYPFIVKVWERATNREALAFWGRTNPKLVNE